MQRTVLLALLIAALGLFVACGDDTDSSATCPTGFTLIAGSCCPDANVKNGICDTTGTCPAGFQLQNGVCVQTSTPDATNGPSDTTTPADTTANQDTGNTGCTPEEQGSRGIGVGCSKDCQCDPAVATECYSGIYLEGFSFCTRHDEGPLDLNEYNSLLLHPTCFGVEPSHPEANTRVYMPLCGSVDDCKALSSAYTHCGTGSFQFGSQARGNECVSQVSGGTNTMGSQNTCLIETLQPYKFAITGDSSP